MADHVKNQLVSFKLFWNVNIYGLIYTGLFKASKPGKCPTPTGAGICLQGCENDFSCEGSQKCVSDSY